MAKVHDLFIVELAEVIKGYGNNPDDKDPFRLSEFYRFYELPNIAVSRENFEKMRPFEERKTGKWIRETKHYKDSEQEFYYYEERCSECGTKRKIGWAGVRYCPMCGTMVQEGEDNERT